MKQKILSMTLAVMMVLGFGLTLSGFMPTAQAADVVSTETELQQAIKDGNEITLAADITLRSAVNITTKTVTIDGAGKTISLESGGYRHFVLATNARLVLKNVTLQGIADTSGGGVKVAGSTLTLEQSTITNCTANNGGGVESSSSTVSFTNSTITNCTSDSKTLGRGGGGGVYSYNSAISFTNCTITNCTTINNGGGVDVDDDSTLSLTNTTITNCTASIDGGGVSASDNSPVTLNGGSITNCSAKYGGGVHASSSTLIIERCPITSCSAGTGGGVYTSFNAYISNSTITDCSSTSGGGMYIYQDTTLTNVKITNCSASSGGGGIYTGGISTYTSSIIMEQSTIENCKADSNGGGIQGSNSTISLVNSNITNCSSEYGGGIHGNINLEGTNSSIKDCSATYTGGGAYGTISLSGITIENCSASRFGGGAGGLINLSGVTIKNCSATTYGGGIYIYTYTTNASNISNSTIENCTGSGVYSSGYTVNLTNSTIKNCTSYGVDISNSTLTLTGSTIENTSNGIRASRSTVNLTGSTIKNCKTDTSGGGVYAFNYSVVTLKENSSIENCTATKDGGGVYLTCNSTLSSDVTTQYKGNEGSKSYNIWDYDGINYACLSIATSYDDNGIPIYSNAINGYDIYWEYCTITLNSNGGTSTASQSLRYGSKVTEPEAPTKDGYTFTGWYIDNNLTERYSFDTLVTNSLTLYAGWQANAITHEPYIEGYVDKTFKPASPISRAEVAQMLYRISGENFEGSSDFPDVASDAWYYDAVTYLTNRGVISGYPNGKFEPDSKISRAELVKMVVIYAQLTEGSETDDSFPDVPSDYWAIWYISTAKDAGYINGYVDGTFHPEQSITRAETVKILNAMLGRTIDEAILADLTMPFTDVEASYWAYNEILEASVKHEH